MNELPVGEYTLKLGKENDQVFYLEVASSGKSNRLMMTQSDVRILLDCCEHALAPNQKLWDVVGGRAGNAQ